MFYFDSTLGRKRADGIFLKNEEIILFPKGRVYIMIFSNINSIIRLILLSPIEIGKIKVHFLKGGLSFE